RAQARRRVRDRQRTYRHHRYPALAPPRNRRGGADRDRGRDRVFPDLVGAGSIYPASEMLVTAPAPPCGRGQPRKETQTYRGEGYVSAYSHAYVSDERTPHPALRATFSRNGRREATPTYAVDHELTARS